MIFVKELTDKLADYPEDVVLVMYGDHLPTMGLTVEDVENKYLFQTEYVMWDNFGLKKKKENLAAYQMAAEVMDRVGIHEGNTFKYHQARRNTKIIRWIWRPCSTIFSTESSIHMTERILLSGQKMRMGNL